MKKLVMLAVFAMLMSIAGSAFAVIDWAGNVWPNNGHNIAPTADQSVYVQIYKDGVTSGPGQGADITADMVYFTDLDATPVTLNMAYLGDNGDNNDEYTAAIPQAAMVGATTITVDFVVTDLTDDSVYAPVNDQNNNPAPLVYNVVNVLPNDVDVSFSICMSGQETVGTVQVIGSAAEIGTWGTGVDMINTDGDLWDVTITFAAGSSPAFEYKFKRDGGAVWEDIGNRPVVLPTDGTTAVALEVQSWNNLPMGCGMGTTLEEDKNVCLQVCMEGVEYTGGVCIAGSLPDQPQWTGVPMDAMGGNLYQFCMIIPAGTAIPLTVEYKFQKDDCANWEGTGNRAVIIDNALDAETTVTSTWEDGPGQCDAVANEGTTWGGLKSQYR